LRTFREMPKLAPRAIALMSCTALVGVAGCGSTSSHSAARAKTSLSASAPLTDAQFVSRRNALCRRFAVDVKALGKPAGNTVPDFVAFLTKTLPVAKAHLAAGRAITPPADKRADYEQLLSIEARALAAVPQEITAARAKDVARISALGTQSNALTQQINALDVKLGTPVCNG
jgi:hypothetical protein